MDKRTRNPIPEKYKIYKQDCKQDCECVRCIDIKIDQFNPKRLLRKRPPRPLSRSSRPLLRPPRPIYNKQRNDELINIICNKINNINFEQQEFNQLPTYKSYKDLEEDMDDCLRILNKKDRQFEELKQELKRDWVKNYQDIEELKKDIKKLKNDFKKLHELLELNDIIIPNEINEQTNQIDEQLFNEQGEQIKKLKED